MKKKNGLIKKLLTSFGAASVLSTIVVSSCASSNDSSTPSNEQDQISTKFKITPTKTNSEDGIYEIINAQAKTNNISVFFIKRNGAFIAIQEVISSILLKQLNPNKEIYFYVGSAINDDDANGKNTIGYESLASQYDNFHFGKSVTTDLSLYDTDLAEVISKLGSDQKIDLFVEDQAIHENNYQLSKNLVKSYPYINTITFTTDGAYNLVFNDNEYNWLKTQSKDQIDNYLNLWTKLFYGKLDINDPNIDWISLSKILPMLVNNSENSDPQKINVWVATNQNFKDWRSANELGEGGVLYNYPLNPGVLNQYGLGLKHVWDLLTDDSKLKFQQAYKVDKEDLSFATGKDNYILLGSRMGETSTPDTEANKVIKFYKDNKKISGDGRQINIIYKPHPRELQANLDELTKLVSEKSLADPEISTTADWFHTINGKIPFEVFLISGLFSDNSTTNTKFRFYLDGYSTTAQVYYDLQASQEQVINYVFNNQTVYDQAVGYYGLLTKVIDFSKKIINS